MPERPYFTRDCITPIVSTRGKLSHKGQWMPELRSEPTLTNIRSSKIKILIDEIMIRHLVNIHLNASISGLKCPPKMGNYPLQKLLITIAVSAKRKTYETFKQSFKKKKKT